MVGTPAKSVEPHKELIHFDHIYYKQEEDGESPTSLPASDLSTKENTSVIPSEIPECTLDIPVISISTTDSDTMHFECDPFSFDGSNLLYTSNVKHCSSPASSDTGYDSSFSASSPCGGNGNAWDDTLTELFPSLV